MRRLIALFLMLSLLAIPTIASAEAPIRLYVNGEEVVAPISPMIENNRTLVPLRALADALGFTVAWEPVGRVITLTKPDLEIVLTVDSPTGLVNGQPVKLDTPPGIRGGYTLIPVRFVIEQMGLKVTWDPETRTIRAATGDTPAAQPTPATPTKPTQPGGASGSMSDALAILSKAMEPYTASAKMTGSYVTSMGSGEDAYKTEMKIETYVKGEDSLAIATSVMALFGEPMESKSGSAVRNGQAWVLNPLTNAWTRSADPEDKPTVEETAEDALGLSDDLSGVKVTITEKSYEGQRMTVVTLLYEKEALARHFSMTLSEIGDGTLEAAYWIKDGAMHHVTTHQYMPHPDGDSTADSIVFYEVLTGPIPFPAEIN